MSDLFIRFLTSILLSVILILCIFNKYVLTITLLIIFFYLFFEFYLLLSKIFKKSKKNKIYFILLFVLIYVNIFTISIWNILVYSDENKIIFFLILSICIASDLGGYIFGKFFKGKKITKISPNKTYSGMIGSYILSLFISLIIFRNHFDYSEIIMYTLILSTISQFGDLFISLLKRKANLKDTGKLLPGHGGLLDRLDGIIFALPLGLILTRILW